MTILQSGLLRKHYEEAVDDIEYKSSAFWMAVLQRAFYEPDIYSVTPESSPDGSLRRVDMVVKRYDQDNHTLSALLWVECKRPSGSVQEVEDQALDAARRCIQRDGLMWIWAMTTVGVSFRMWFVDARGGQLVPMHGTAAQADRRQYIDANSPAASVFPDAIQSIKNGYPLRQAPVLPSQSLDLLTSNDAEWGASESYMSGMPTQNQDQYYGVEAGPSSYSGNDIGGQPVEVRVERITHGFSRAPDEYVFRDINNKRRSTRKENWETGEYQGERVWFYHGRKTTYFSRRKIG
ncbi:uncharacterized protein BKA55DRAFT_524309 [Fusarium redolens]|jgi:hypothetical protein|uniref:Uncharacterized protein n=1 Tax=Fusarium redolens TaxID=48865 RepID=A0A9P9JTL2_FUSRE|nr:uncharacterized protein BKA55DRAFT_524309 [Fusarium redolens]KAH7231705.1 hypothetical protein BKA55DRAFT_524309 [Fusarium redolens]